MQNLNKKKVVVIDFRLGNLYSVVQACKMIGLDVEITDNKDTILKADGLILPGVGAFGDAIRNLRQRDLIGLIKDFIDTGKPFMGICLGLQLLFTESEEFGNYKGLDIIPGMVRKFQNPNKKIKVPQIGWNRIFPSKSWKNTPLATVEKGEFMYFVHSYFVEPENDSYILTETNYEGVEYCSSVYYKNIFATQFHPEKSGKKGLEIYKQWSKQL